jgi:hypothetical protein
MDGPRDPVLRPQGLKPNFFRAFGGTTEQLAEKVILPGGQRPQPGIDSTALTASLKRCPDTNQSFSAACEAVPSHKTIYETVLVSEEEGGQVAASF